MTTIVNDTSEAVCLSSDYKVYLKPIAKMTISVALPHLKLPGKSISNWEVMERVKAMVAPEQFSSLRISKSTLEFIRFEGEVENKMVVKSLLSHLDGKSIKLSGFTDVLKVSLILQSSGAEIKNVLLEYIDVERTDVLLKAISHPVFPLLLRFVQ